MTSRTRWSLNQKMVQYRENLGVALLEAGEPVDALVELTKAVEMNPQSDPAFNHRGLANSRLERYHRAIEDFTIAISLNPSNAVVFCQSISGSCQVRLSLVGQERLESGLRLK